MAYERKPMKDEALIAHMDELRRSILPSRRPRVREIKLNWAQYHGRHYVEVDRATGAITGTPKPDNTPGLRRVTLNFCRPAADLRASSLTFDPLRLIAVPTDSTQQSRDSARYKTKVLRAKWDELGMDEILYEALLWQWLGGTAHFLTMWDDHAQGVLPGSTTEGGDVGTQLITGLELWCPPYFRKIHHAPDFFIERLISKDDACERFPGFDPGDSSHGDSARDEEFDTQNFLAIVAGTSTSGGMRAKDMVRETMYFHRKDSIYKKGILAYRINDKIVYRNDEGGRVLYSDGKKLEGDAVPKETPQGILTPGNYIPLVTIKDKPIPFSLDGAPTATDGRYVNEAIERHISAGSEYLDKAAWGKILVDEDAHIGGYNDFTDDFLGIIRYKSMMGQPPQILQGPQVPDSLFRMNQTMDDYFRRTVDYQEVANGEAIPNARTEGIIENMSNLNSVKKKRSLNVLKTAIPLIGEMIMREIAEHYSTKRKFIMAGPNGQTEVFAFDKTAMAGNTRVQLQVSTMDSDSITSRRALAQYLWKDNIILSAVGGDQQRAAQEIIQLMGMEHDFDETPHPDAIHRRMAEWENSQFEKLMSGVTASDQNKRIPRDMIAQKMPTVEEYHEHAIHLPEHEKVLNETRFAQFLLEYPEEGTILKKLMLEHIESHKKGIVLGKIEEQEMAQAAQMALAPQGGMAEGEPPPQEMMMEGAPNV